MLSVVHLQLSPCIRASQATQADRANAAKYAHRVNQPPATAGADAVGTAEGYGGLQRVGIDFRQAGFGVIAAIEEPFRGDLAGVSAPGVDVDAAGIGATGHSLDLQTLKPEGDVTRSAFLHPVHRLNQVEELPLLPLRLRGLTVEVILSFLKRPGIGLGAEVVGDPLPEAGGRKRLHDRPCLFDGQVGAELDQSAGLGGDLIVHGPKAVRGSPADFLIIAPWAEDLSTPPEEPSCPIPETDRQCK